MRGAFLVCKKEFLELSKDRRTLFFSFVLPILLYPAIFLVMAKLTRSDADRRQATPSRVAILDPSQVLEPRLRKESKLFQVEPAIAPRKALMDQALDLYIEVEPHAAEKQARMETFQIKALVDASEPGSNQALDRLKRTMAGLDRERVAQRLEALKAPIQLTEPSRIIAENAADAGLETGKALGAFLPYILMLMMFQGAMQHGIHVTAGEKERGTLQSLLATPLPRIQIIWGKLIFIFSMGLIAAILNLLSMSISLGLVMGASRVGGGTAGPMNLSAVTNPWILLVCFFLLVPLGLLFTSFILFMGIRARGTAEAGTSLMPGLFLILTLGAVSMAPGLERTPWLAYVPILNVSLAIRKLFGQQGDILEVLMAFLMTTVLSLLMAWAATRLLDRESAIFRQS